MSERSENLAIDSAVPKNLFIDDAELKIHKLYRERIVQEDNLIHSRMLWMLNSQSFLVLLWAALYKFGSSPQWYSDFVDIIGIYFAFQSRESINAAQEEIMHLDGIYRGIYKKYDSNDIVNVLGIINEKNKYVPNLIGGGKRHDRGHGVTKYMPILIITIWFFILFGSLWVQFSDSIFQAFIVGFFGKCLHR